MRRTDLEETCQDMDQRGDNLSYLKYFADKAQSFLLQNAEEPLEAEDPSLQVESMFTGIDCSSTWNVEGYPIFLNGAFISEDEPIESTIALDSDKMQLSELYEETEVQESPETDNTEDSNSSVSHPIVQEVPGKSIVTQDGLFVPNELLLQLNPQNESDLRTDGTLHVHPTLPDTQHSVMTETIEKNKKKQLLECETSNIVNNLNDKVTDVNTIRNELLMNWNDIGDVIQLLSGDGSVIAVDKSVLSNLVLPNSNGAPVNTAIDYENMYETVTAFKCKFCSYLCEGQKQEIVQHLENEHLTKQFKKAVNESDLRNEAQPEEENLIKTVEMRSILTSSHKKETKQTVYLCSQCNMGYASKSNLKEHMIIKHNLVHLSEIRSTEQKVENETDKKPHANSLVSVESKPKVSNDHLTNLVKKQHKALKRVKCSFKGCEVRFARDNLRVSHEACHDDGQKKQFKCPECLEKFSAWRICSSHLWKCHRIDMGLLTCPMCEFRSISLGRMKVHMAVHGEEYPFICHECSKGFKQYAQLKNHQVIHKSPELDNIPEWASQKQCDICKKYFANSKTLKKHIQSVHNKYKPFICNICGHKTTRKAMLDLHLRQHTGEKPHKCPICVYKTGDPNSLRRHVMRHEGLTKYSCPHCEYQSIQSTSYKNHIANKHPGKGGSFYCSICSYHTVSETAYYAHKLEHELPVRNNLNNCDGTDSVDSLVMRANLSRSCDSGSGQLNNILNNDMKLDDDETQNCFLNTDLTDDTIDTGGITIPAGFELQVSL